MTSRIHALETGSLPGSPEAGFHQRYKDTLASWPSGVAVVTAQEGALLYGTTVASFTSLSLEPPMILVCLTQKSRLVEVIRSVKSFAVSILAESQAQVSKLFSLSDREPSLDLHGLADLPIGGVTPGIAGSIALLDCHLDAIVPVGDHFIVTADVRGTSIQDDTEPLVYHRRGYRSFADVEPGGAA